MHATISISELCSEAVLLTTGSSTRDGAKAKRAASTTAVDSLEPTLTLAATILLAFTIIAATVGTAAGAAVSARLPAMFLIAGARGRRIGSALPMPMTLLAREGAGADFNFTGNTFDTGRALTLVARRSRYGNAPANASALIHTLRCTLAAGPAPVAIADAMGVIDTGTVAIAVLGTQGSFASVASPSFVADTAATDAAPVLALVGAALLVARFTGPACMASAFKCTLVAVAVT